MQPTKLGVLLKGIAKTRNPEMLISSVVTNSLDVKQGSVFIAVVGDRMDGHDFVKDAFQNGAAVAIVSKVLEDGEGEQILVTDTKDAYIRMAGNYKEQFDPITVAVTGSVGKTTTKEMVAAIFRSFGTTLKNEGNLNNEIGLPKTIFEIDKSTELAVLEMGMNNLGDIRKLTMAVKPRAAIITAIGISHIEHLKTQANILKAKLEIVEGMPKNGVLVINGDDPLLMGARKSIPIETVTFAIENSYADVVAKDIMIRPNKSEFTISDRNNGDFKAMIPAVGNHNIMDALSAYTLATRIGFDPKTSAEALRNYQPVGMRQNIVEFNGITVVEDCYNANPDSMRAALSALAALPVDGIRAAVLGDMLELGERAAEEHRRIGMFAAKSGIEVLLCYGDLMKQTAEAAKAAGITSVKWFSEKKPLAEYLTKTLHSGDAVIFKGSRGMKLEDVIEMFYRP